MFSELSEALATRSVEAFSGLLRRRLQQLGVGLLDGRAIARAEADALAAEVVELARRAVCDTFADRPGDGLRMLDIVRAAGFVALEPERSRLEAERTRRFPPPAAVSWREIGEVRALAERHPELCQVGPPASHVEFTVRLAAEGTELPVELLALYAACDRIALTCRHVAAPAGGICAGDALRVREGRAVLIERRKRHPATMLIEQPGVSIAQALGTWWMVLEDDRAPATRRPLDLQALLRFALQRVEAASLEILVTDLAWSRFFR